MAQYPPLRITNANESHRCDRKTQNFLTSHHFHLRTLLNRLVVVDILDPNLLSTEDLVLVYFLILHFVSVGQLEIAQQHWDSNLVATYPHLYL